MWRKENKYRAKSTFVDGFYFPSTGEANRYRDLKLLQDANEIQQLSVHPRYPIVVNGNRVCFVALDFVYFNVTLNQWIYEDFKGHYTSESKLRHKLFKAMYDSEIVITRKGDLNHGRSKRSNFRRRKT